MAKRGEYAKTRARKAAIAQAALDLVQSRGHRNFTTLDVAERSRVSEALIFYHYPNREALLVAALHRFDDAEIEKSSTFGVLATMRANAREGVARTNIVRLYAEMAGQSVDPAHPAHAYFRSRWERSIAGLQGDIEMLDRRGLLATAVDAARVARVLISAWEGLQLYCLHDRTIDIGAELEALASGLLGLESLDSIASNSETLAAEVEK